MVKAQTTRMTKPRSESVLSPDEVEEWLKFFEKPGR
jgi:hypothetical protein